MILEHFNYKNFQEKFYSKISDVSVFESGGINFIKVIMESLVVRYASKGKIRAFIFFPFPDFFLFFRSVFIRIFKSKHVTEKNNFIYQFKLNKPDVVLIDNGRTVNNSDGIRVSVYFHNLRQNLNKRGVSFFHYNESNSVSCYDDMFSDLNFKDFILTSKLSDLEKKVINDLINLYNKCCTNNIFDTSELQHLKYGLTIFFNHFRQWNFYFSKFKPKAVFLLSHYHHEGLIFACKINNVKVIELQHGLIANEDIFYVMPKLLESIRKKALFSDEIYTYGDYWKEILNRGFEFENKTIKKIGYYLFDESNLSEKEYSFFNELIGSKPVVLITTQPALHASFLNYIERWNEVLKKQKKDVIIIVKLHPADQDIWYESLQNLSNVLITRTRIEALFKLAYIHVTSYSTTIFDALRYGVSSYSINFPEASDYVEQITKDKLSEKIEINNFPIIPTKKAESINSNFTYYFEEVNYDFLNDFR